MHWADFELAIPVLESTSSGRWRSLLRKQLINYVETKYSHFQISTLYHDVVFQHMFCACVYNWDEPFGFRSACVFRMNILRANV